MEDVRTRPLTQTDRLTFRHSISQVLVLAYILLGLAAYLAAPFLAMNWIRLPFIGAFTEPALIFNGAAPVDSAASWPAYQLGVRYGDQLLSVNGVIVTRSSEIQSILARSRVGDTADLQVRAANGQLRSYTVRLVVFPLTDQLTFFYFPYLIGLVYLGSAVWLFSIRRHHPSGRAFALFSMSVALAIGLLFDLYTTHVLAPVWALAVAMLGASLVFLILIFPREDPVLQNRPWLRYGSFGLAFVLAVFTITRLYDVRHPLAYRQAMQVEYAFIALALAFVLGWSLYRRRRVVWPADREQVRWVAWASLVSFAPLGIWLAGVSIGLALPFSPYLLFPLLVFPVMSGFTVQRYRMAQADVVLSQGLYYGLMGILVAAGYALMAAGLGLLIGHLLAPNSPLLTALIFFVLALLLNPLREHTQRLVNNAFFRGKRAYQDRLQTLSGDLTRTVDLPGIVRVLSGYVDDTLAPTQMHIYIYDLLSDQYVAAPGKSGRPTSDLRFSTLSGLVNRLRESRAPLMLNEFDALPKALEPERPRLALLGAEIFVPLPGRQRLSGWLALGPRKSGEPYTSLQFSFAEALCDQAALAIERAQVVANMENRVREMNVLTRIAQGINITLSLDDILELVYAQTTQIIPARYFRIMLYDKENDAFSYAFYLEQDERLNEQENHIVPTGQALEQEVIRLRRAVLTNDYLYECQRRSVMVEKQGIYAWLGVPLNAGAEAIGALSLGSSDPAIEYTAEQQGLLQAIADQVAGALVKARLLQETERRARQLTMLNEVTRQLSSTLETEPLLQLILQSAVDILRCEAGSLLLVDSVADELVFRVATGPVAERLVNQRMPIDHGVAGKAVRTGEAIIVNDARQYAEWSPDPDQQTGFVTHTMLAIPLVFKDHVMGVIEVINKMDGTYFTGGDQQLLSAFASQAAVAIENARLYTLTDLALAARVEELSVMQRIDRELNTSLDTSRAMRITLEWAMRQSGANAGLVGVLNEEDLSGVRVMAFEGYGSEVEPYQDALLPANEFALNEVIESSASVRRSLAGPEWIKPLLRGGKSQAILPIRRETNTIGLLLLESTSDIPLADDTMNFLSRLTDHASIAISNAQLYGAVQQANLAKSDFVSFVAHELKNPMTSVKGYTELIASGATGPITDMQTNFLSTIRHNIERMNTLVSDLNDMSKIEVGRLRLDFKATNLNDVIESVVRSTRKQIEEKQQQLKITIPGDLPALWADRSRLEQVLVNVVSNAHKYTPSGGEVELSAEQCDNQWDPNGAARVVHIWVKDNGIGISEEDQKKIFQKFFRSEDPKTREVTGTGLGLNITKSLVEMQGGRIWFESVFREGTTFHFTVPVSEN